MIGVSSHSQLRIVRHFQTPLRQSGTLLVASHDREQCQRCFCDLTTSWWGLTVSSCLLLLSQWRELDVTSRTVQSTVLTAEKFVKTAQLLESGQSPGPNASSRGYYIPEAGQGVSVTAAAPEALRVLRSVFSLDKKVGGSVSVCHEEQYVEKDRQTTARGETVGAACPLYCCHFRPGSCFWLVSPQLSSWLQIRN